MVRRTAILFLALAGCGGGGSSAPPTPDAGISNDIRPGKRSDIAALGDPATGSIMVFGGNDGPIVDQIPKAEYLGDTWRFDPDQGWTDVSGDTAPSARGRYAVSSDPAGRVLIYGGRWRQAGTSGNYTLYSDLWAFDTATNGWSEVDPGTTGAPSPRYYAVSAYDSDAGRLFVYGGDTNPSALTINPSQEVWSYGGGAWQQESPTGTVPAPARLYMAYTYDSQRNRLVVFGGQVGDFVSPGLNDLYALDLSSMTWSQLHDGTGTAPAGRFSAMMSYDAARDRYLVFGGHADPGVANDLWAFDPTAGSWSELATGDTFTGGALGCGGNAAEIPADYVNQDLTAPERRSGGMFAVVGDSVWLFGGVSDCSDHLDDTWRYDLVADSWSQVIEARSAESCARRNDSCTCLCL